MIAYLCPGCGRTQHSRGRCAACRRPADQKKRERANWRTVYNTSRWRKLRALVLARDGHTCATCGAPATSVNHTVPFDGPFDPVAWDPVMLEASCASCNSREAAQRQARSRR